MYCEALFNGVFTNTLEASLFETQQDYVMLFHLSSLGMHIYIIPNNQTSAEENSTLIHESGLLFYTPFAKDNHDLA